MTIENEAKMNNGFEEEIKITEPTTNGTAEEDKDKISWPEVVASERAEGVFEETLEYDSSNDGLTYEGSEDSESESEEGSEANEDVKLIHEEDKETLKDEEIKTEPAKINNESRQHDTDESIKNSKYKIIFMECLVGVGK